MRTIYKVTPRDGGPTDIQKGAKLLCLQLQNDTPIIWYECESGAPIVKRLLTIVGTGWDLTNIKGNYFATYQEGFYVWHLFDAGEI